MTDPLKAAEQAAREHTRRQAALYEKFPALQEELDRNIRKYGVPTLSGGIGGLTTYNLPSQLYHVLHDVGTYHPVEVQICPADPEAHHYDLNWFVLVYDPASDKLRRAIEVEKEQQGELP